MHERQRRDAILGLLAQRRMATVDELVAQLGVSVSTVRRDISRLDALRLIERIPGGAKRREVGLGAAEMFERLSDPADPAADRKRAIGRAAAALCAEGESIMVSSGSTTDRLIEHLARRRLQVFTNSLRAAAFLSFCTDNQVCIAGGEVYRERNLILDLDDGSSLGHYHASKLFLGALGVTAQGVTESDSLVVRAERRLIACADQVILLVDSGKFLPRGNLILCPLSQVSTVVTDSGLAPAGRDMLERAGCRVVVAADGAAGSADGPGGRADGRHEPRARDWASA